MSDNAAPATPAASTEADIAAFLADGVADDSPIETVDDTAVAEGEETETTEDASESETDDATEEASPAPATAKVDTKALLAALDKQDPAAFIEALGPAAESVLGSKAHKVLRLQVKEVKKGQESAQAAQTKAQELAQALSSKYSDPITARKAADAGDVDTFVDMVEKWAGKDWNSVMRWAANGITGRPARLEAKAREEKADQAKESAKQAEATEQARTWITDSLKKVDTKLATEYPEVVDMIMTEIKSGHAKGIDTPAKALPLVKAKLKTQYERLTKYFTAPGKRPKPPVVATRLNRDQPDTTRPMSMDEEIASFVKAEGLRK